MGLKVEIYGRDDCRFCVAAVAHCQKRGYSFVYNDVSTEPYWADLINRLGNLPESVPQIFIGDHHIGGFSDLKANDGAVQQILGGH